MRARKPSYVSHDGFLMPMGFPVDGFISGLGYRAQAGDVFVATYPKCGTTWTQYLVYLMLHRGRPLKAGQNINDAFPHLEEVGQEVVRRLAPPRLIKTHLPFGRTPYHEQAKYIYVARNPFDCVVSFYHHTRGFVRHYDFADGTFDEFFECFVTGEVDFGDYFDNLLSWYRRKDDGNVLFMSYEELAADLRGVVVRLGGFLGGDAAEAVHDVEILERIIEHSSFRRMSKSQSRWSSRRPPGMPDFVRKGVVGDWVNHFSPRQACRLVSRFVEKTRGTGAEQLWPDILEAARSLAAPAS